MATNNKNYVKAELKTAYNKYKTFIYYDSSELFQRAKIAEFEANIDKKLDDLAKKIIRYDDTQNAEEVFGEIKMHYLPKSFVEENGSDANFITNQRVEDLYNLDKVIVMADVSVEWHLITVLWIMRYGYLLDGMLSDDCRGNRLLVDKDTKELNMGGSLFKPYFNQYQQWRDDAVEMAQQRLLKGKNMAFVNIDIKDFFYSAAIDFDKIKEDIETELEKHDPEKVKVFGECNLHKLFEFLHVCYSDKLKVREYPFEYSDSYAGKHILPIGLSSSYILANHYLIDFDKRMRNLIPHVYYGRYVDDILVVIESPDFNYHNKEKCGQIKIDTEQLSTADKFVYERFNQVLDLIERPEHINDTEKDFCFKLKCYDNCYIQPAKTLVYYFDKNESTAVIDKLKHDLNVRASEFRDFPEEGEDLSAFDDSAYHLIFDDSDGKIRTLKDYKENRLGISVFLAKRIFAALRRTTKTDKNECKRVVRLFRGVTGLMCFRMWEKVFTFLVVNEQEELFSEFLQHTYNQINKIEINKKKELEINTSLMLYLKIAVDMALSLNNNFKIKDIGIDKRGGEIDLDSKIDFRSSYMVRHHYTVHPLATLTKNVMSLADLTDIDMLQLNGNAEIIEPDEDNAYKIPRRVKFWECCIAQVNEAIMEDSYKIGAIDGAEMLDASFEKYKAINKLYFSYNDTHKKTNNEFYSTTKSKVNEYCNVELCEFKIGNGRWYKNDETDRDNRPKIAIANTQVDGKHILAGIRGETIVDTTRYNTLAKILKEARETKSDVLIMPECSVPVTLLSSLAKYSAENGIMIVTGLEHWNVNGVVFNFIVTIAPVTVGNTKDAVVMYRLKNHYSPDEEVQIEGYGFNVPTRKPSRYFIINWKGIYSTSFYCFELANAQHRSLLRGKVDLIIISEFNRDIPYYDNIVGATSRDLHCYVAQVNTSQYGDSRLTQPTVSATKDILKLKGGLNDTILTERININALREFQLKSYELSVSDKDKSFKPLPPDWNRELVIRRKMGKFVLGEPEKKSIVDIFDSSYLLYDDKLPF